MSLQYDIESFLGEEFGAFSIVHTAQSRGHDFIDYCQDLNGYPTILMVVRPPLDYHVKTKYILEQPHYPIKFFLFDKSTNLMIGTVSKIDIDEHWRDNLKNVFHTSQHKAYRSICPKCGCWLQQKNNTKSEQFIGCSGYPPCDYTLSLEIYKCYE